MADTITAAKQITFDKELFKQIKLLDSLASPGSSVTFTGEDNVLCVTFHGKEVESRCRFDTDCAAAFSFSMNGKDFMDVFKSFDEGVITVRDKFLAFKSGYTKMNRALPTDIPEPVLPDLSEIKMTTLPPTAFRDAAFASYAAAQGSNGDAGERVSMLIGEGAVSVVATNGIIAVHATAPADDKGPAIEYLLHPRAIEPLAELAAKEDAPPAYIGSDSHRYLISFGDIEVAMRIPETPSVRATVTGTLEKLAKIPATQVAFDRARLATFLGRAKLLDAGLTQWRPVVLTPDAEGQTVGLRHASSIGDIQDTVDAEFSGAPLPQTRIGFGLRNMAEMCGHIRTTPIKMSIRGQLAPALITEEAGDTVVTHVLLPVRPQSFQDAPEPDGGQAQNPAPPPVVSPDDF